MQKLQLVQDAGRIPVYLENSSNGRAAQVAIGFQGKTLIWKEASIETIHTGETPYKYAVQEEF